MRKLLLTFLALVSFGCNKDSNMNTGKITEKSFSLPIATSSVPATIAIPASSTQATTTAKPNSANWPATTQPDLTCPSKIQNLFECNRHIEEELGKIYPGLFVRKGLNLAIQLSSGKTLTIPDSSEKEPEKNQLVSFVKYFPEIQYGVLSVNGDEWAAYKLINIRTGNSWNLGGWAYLSPDKQRLAYADCDISESAPCVLGILFVSETDIHEEFKIETNDWQAGKLNWIDSKYIEFNQLSVDPMNPHEEKHSLRFSGEQINKFGRWELK